ncbi:MAG: hypothetical protein ACIAXF_14205 [Phycisphaerales bacterium JB063]
MTTPAKHLDPWKMTLAKYIASNPDITSTRPAVPKPRFVADHGVLRSSNRMSRAQARDCDQTQNRRWAEHCESLRDWDRRREAGGIPDVKVTRKANPDSLCDAAKLRSMHRRAVYAAVGRGESVPAAVLVDYPSLLGEATA